MLVILSDALCDTDLAGPLSDRVRDPICNLGLAHYEGSHLVAVSHRLKKCLCALKELGERERRAFVRSSWDLDLAVQLRGEVLAYVLVHPLGTPWRVEVPARPGAGTPVVFHVDLAFFKTSDRARGCQLVGEDLRDAGIYRRIGDAYRVRHRLDTSHKMQCIDGGGIKTGQTFQTHARQGMALCIVDTDASDVGAEPRDTATRALSARVELHREGAVADAHALPCHELENLLPARLVLDAAPRGQEGERARLHAAALGQVDHVDLKSSIGPRIAAWVEAHLQATTAPKLAEYCFAPECHPYLAELGALVWSWGLGPPSGKARV